MSVQLSAYQQAFKLRCINMKCNLQWGITEIIMTICINSGLHKFLIDSLEAMHRVCDKIAQHIP